MVSLLGEEGSPGSMTTLHELARRTTHEPTGRLASDDSITALRRTNLGLAVIHAAQAAVILALSNSLSLPVTAAFGNGPPGQPDGPVELDTLFSYALGPAVALFLFLSAGFHLLVSTPWGAAPLRRRAASGAEPLPLGRVLHVRRR